MPNFEVMFHDRDGFHYKHPERDCKKCLNYPCIEGLKDVLIGNFAKYGCKEYSDPDVFHIWRSKR